MTPRLAYPLHEAAQLVNLSVRSLRYLMHKGRLGYVRLGRRVMIPHAELEKLLKWAFVKPTHTIDADDPLRPRSKNSNAHEA